MSNIDLFVGCLVSGMVIGWTKRLPEEAHLPLNPTLVTLMVGRAITLSFVTLPAWWYSLNAAS